MDILGIGASELIFILLIAIIVLGPRDMQKAGRSVGRWLNQFVRSDGWKALQRASKEIRSLPTNLMREANLEELREMDREIRNNIDPRPRPPETRKNPEPSTANPGEVPSQSPSTDSTSDHNPELQ
jgi:sec-independent protein translocase protein TatB